MSKDVATVSPMEDDATLREVRFLSSQEIVAIGDRGVVWRSTDGGETWSFVHVPTSASLRGMHFVTNQVGWIVGRDVAPYTQVSTGVVLYTEDGGRTWKRRGTQALPGLESVQFFGPEQGIAVGDSSADFPSGIIETSDGGQTWRAVEGAGAEGWEALACFGPQEGVVSGVRGGHGVIGQGRLMPLPPDFGLPGMHGVSVDATGRGWMVGDGAL
ncbi:MAG: hypothetical protein R3C01_09285, partial [Planctomycetaceae bacterium]